MLPRPLRNVMINITQGKSLSRSRSGEGNIYVSDVFSRESGGHRARFLPRVYKCISKPFVFYVFGELN